MLQKLERLDDVLIRVFAGFEIAEGGLCPVAGVGKTAHASEHPRCVLACLAGSEMILHGFLISDRFLKVRKGGTEPPSLAPYNPELVVSNRKLPDCVSREHFKRLAVIFSGL
ncbi:MAG: hypothetical protein WBW58_02835 [Candidatus Acidiferrum sp.]